MRWKNNSIPDARNRAQQNSRDKESGTPPGCGFFYYLVPVVSVAARPQPPAKIWHPSGMRCFLFQVPVVSLAKPRSTTG
jgi:hypothetical protein